MVSEPFESSAGSVMANRSDDDACMLRFTLRSGSKLSDVKNFIAQHFKFPRPQVTHSEDGGVVITRLFEGIPDDIENQDHERFDHILEFVDWIERRAELPTISEGKMSTIEPPAHFFHKELEVLDKSLVMNDDLLTEAELEIGDVEISDGEIVQMELKDDLISTKEFSDPVAHQVFDGIPLTKEWLDDAIRTEGKYLTVNNTPLLMEFEKCITSWVAKGDCVETLIFDPGGRGFRLGGSFVSNDNGLINGKLDHKAILVGFVEEQNGLKTFEAVKVGEHKGYISPMSSDGEPHNLKDFEVYNLNLMLLLLIVNRPIDHIKLMIDILIVDDIENVYAKMRCFDPGGGLYASSEVYIHFKLSNVDIFMMMGFEKWKSAFDMLCLVTNAYVGVLIFDPGGEMIVGKSVIFAIFADFNPVDIDINLTTNYFTLGYVCTEIETHLFGWVVCLEIPYFGPGEDCL